MAALAEAKRARETVKPALRKVAAPIVHSVPPSLRDLAYDQIKHMIITCALKPGEYVNEANLSAALGIGRTPVHQAIDRLMVESMVEVIPRKGVIIKPVSLDEILQIIDVRLVNETVAASLAAERADPGEIADMRGVVRRAREATKTRRLEQLMRLDREFHLVIARATGNPVLAEILRNLHERSLRFWFISLRVPAQHERLQGEHEAIIEAIRARDPERASVAMRDHIESLRSNLVRYLSTHPSGELSGTPAIQEPSGRTEGSLN